MKTHFHTSVAARLLISLFTMSVMTLLVGCEQNDVYLGQAQPDRVCVTNPLPKPTIICLKCIDGDLPRIDPQPRTQK